MLPVVALFALAQLGQVDLSLGGPVLSAPARLGQAPPVFRLLPPTGEGAPVMADVCSTHASDISSGSTAYFCLRGDGTSTSSGGSYALTTVGSPVVSSRRHCNNGLDCAEATHLRTSINDYFRTASPVPNAPGHFSICMLIERDANIGQALVSKYNTTTPTRAWSMNVSTNGGGAAHLWLYNGGGGFAASSTSTGSNLVLPRTPHFHCYTYESVSSTTATNIGRSYADGALVNTSAVLPPPEPGTEYIRIGRSGDPAVLPYAGFIHHIIYTEKLLDEPTIAAMAKTAIGKLTGAADEPVAMSRVTTRSCSASDGAMVWLAMGRPCVTQGGLSSEPVGTNLMLRTEEFENATWSKTGISVAANTVLALDGTMTADRVTEDAATGEHRTWQYTGATTSTVRTCSVYAKAGTRQWLGIRCWGNVNAANFNLSNCTVGTTNAGLGVTAGALALNDGWCRVWATTTGTEGYFTINLGDADTGTGNAYNYTGNGTGYIDLWGAQAEVGAIPTSVMRAEGATVTRGAEVATVPTPSRFSRTSGSARVTFRPLWTGATPGTTLLSTSTNAKVFWTRAAGGDQIAAYANTGLTSAAVGGFVAGVPKDYRTTWSAAANSLRVHAGSTAGVAVGFTTWPVSTTWGLGNNVSTNLEQATGVISNLVVCSTPTAPECAQ
jgi:hypothetical protein